MQINVSKKWRESIRVRQLTNAIESVSPNDFEITVRSAAEAIRNCYDDEHLHANIFGCDMDRICDYRFLLHCADLLNEH